MAVLATAGALTTVEKIRAKAAVTRAALNQEMGGLASMVEGVELSFTSKAGETGKLYGSITTQMIADALNQKLGSQIDRHQVEVEPIRMLGEHHATIRLTIDLNPKVKIFVTREGEVVAKAEKTSAKETKAIEVEKPAETQESETVAEPPAEEPKAE